MTPVRGEILAPEVTPNGVGIVQIRGRLIAVSLCCRFKMKRHINIIDWICGRCGSGTPRRIFYDGSPVLTFTTGLAEWENAVMVQDFVCSWTGFKPEDFELELSYT